MDKKFYPGGFRLTLKTARALDVQEFGPARGLKAGPSTNLEGFFRMEMGNRAGISTDEQPPLHHHRHSCFVVTEGT